MVPNKLKLRTGRQPCWQAVPSLSSISPKELKNPAAHILHLLCRDSRGCALAAPPELRSLFFLGLAACCGHLFRRAVSFGSYTKLCSNTGWCCLTALSCNFPIQLQTGC